MSTSAPPPRRRRFERGLFAVFGPAQIGPFGPPAAVPVEVRPASDPESALEVWRRASAARGLPVEPAREQQVRAAVAAPGALLLVAVREEQDVLGMALSAPSVDGEAELSMVFVEPRMQQRGVGAALVDDAVRALRDRGDTRITAWLRSTNAGALALGRSRGFSATGRSDALPGGDQVLQLARRL